MDFTHLSSTQVLCVFLSIMTFLDDNVYVHSFNTKIICIKKKKINNSLANEIDL